MSDALKGEDDLKTIAAIAAEFWKVLRALERAAEAANDAAKPRIQAQARYATGRLDAILAERGMSVVAFDGRRFEVNLPVSAVNADDFPDSDELVVERTIEPTIVADMVPVITGKVYLARSEADASRD
jgi:hypothetical protein